MGVFYYLGKNGGKQMSDEEMMNLGDQGEVKENMEILEEKLMRGHHIDPNLYLEYDVKRGLRDSAGKGVLTGLTEISDVCAYDLVNGRRIPAEGSLFYQGINIYDIVAGLKGRKFGFEETTEIYKSYDERRTYILKR